MTTAEHAELIMMTHEAYRLDNENERLRQAMSACGVEIDENGEPKISEQDKRTPDQIASANEIILEALQEAKRFIQNGIRFGYILVPEKDDPACETLNTINKAIAAAKGDAK